jgi:hypothetical protein
MAGHWPKGLDEINGEKTGAGFPSAPWFLHHWRSSARKSDAQLGPKDDYLVAGDSPGKNAAGKRPDVAQGRLDPSEPESEMTNKPSKTQGFITQLGLISN